MQKIWIKIYFFVKILIFKELRRQVDYFHHLYHLFFFYYSESSWSVNVYVDYEVK